DHVEDQLLDLRVGEIAINPTFDLEHAQVVHGAMFDGFYTWAGECRQVPLSDGLLDFAPYDDLASTVNKASQAFRAFLTSGGDREDFISSTCEAAAWWNYAHPFREGNGRTMKVVLDQFANFTPWQFDYARVTPDQWNTAFMLSMPAPDTEWQSQPANLYPVFNTITLNRSGSTSDARLRR
ncbi:MAG: Fic family protein, partial [Brevibacterium sp.]|nr:Fic family protein [Brevibacterium sp.]